MAKATPKAKEPKVATPRKSPALINRSNTHWPSRKAVNRPKAQRAPWQKANG